MIARFVLLATFVLAPALNSFAASLDIYKAIPSSSLGFLLVNRLSETGDKLDKAAQQLQIPAPPLLMMLKSMTGLTALNENEAAAAVAFPGAAPADGPRLAVLAPTVDYDKLLAALQPDNPKATIAHVTLGQFPAIAAKKGAYAVFMGPTPADEAALETFLAASGDVSGIVKPLKKWLDTQEIAVVVAPDGMGMVFQQLDMGLGLAGATRPPDQAALFKTLSNAIKTCRSEVSHFALGLGIDDGGALGLTARAIFLPAGAFTRAAKDAAIAEPDLFASLPSGPFVFAGAGALPEAWSDAIADLSIQLIKSSPDAKLTAEEQANLAEATRQLMKGMRGMSMVMGVPKPGEAIYSRMAALMRVTNSQKYLDDQKKSGEALGKLKINGGAYQVKMQKVAGFPGMEITSPIAPVADGPNAAMQKAMMEKLLGKESTQKTYLAAVNPTTVAMALVNPENIAPLAARLKSGGDGLATDPAILQTAALLPKDCQWTMYISAEGAVSLARNVVQVAPPPGQAAPPIPDFPQAPPIGLTAKMLAFGFEARLVVPGATVAAIGEYVQKVKGGN